MMKKLSLLLCTSFLVGCSILVQDEPLPLYTLKSGDVKSTHVLSTSLAIDMPLSEASLDTQRIALTPSPYERDYIADGQWPDRLPKIIQEVLLEGLSERWGEASVSRMSSGLQATSLLQTEVHDFSVYYLNTEHPEVHLKIAFKVVDLRARKVWMGKVFSVKEPICLVSMKGIVEAFNKGLHKLLQQAMLWMEGALKERPLNARNNKLGR